MTPAHQDRRAVLGFLLAIVGLHGALTLTGMWHDWAWPAIAVSFIALVLICERIGRHVPLRARKFYERTLALGFPALVLAVWELAGALELISPVWFPPPSAIGRALWDVTVTYDRFSETSLLGRPWLIPQEFRAGGLAAVGVLLSESHVLATIRRVFAGFLLGAIPGIMLGLALGINPTLRLTLDTPLAPL